MFKIKDVAMVMVLLSYFQGIGVRTDVRTYGLSRDTQNLFDRWVTKFSKVWGSARTPSVRRSSAISGNPRHKYCSVGPVIKESLLILFVCLFVSHFVRTNLGRSAG